MIDKNNICALTLRRNYFLVFLFVIIFAVLSSASLISQSLGWDITVIPVGEADVAVYVVAFDGVDGCGVGDVSRIVEGVVAACQVNSSRYYTGNVNPYTGEWYGPTPVVFVEIKINTTVTVVTDWDVYKHLV